MIDHRLDLNVDNQFRQIRTPSSCCSLPSEIVNASLCAEQNPSLTYQRLAHLYCFIDDYPAWLEQQSILEYFLQFAQYFYVDVDLVKKALEQYRLQHECLKVVERHPILIGGG